MWCSALFIPATEPRFLEKAAQRGADAIVLDLEASVVEDRKAEAREAARKNKDFAAADRLRDEIAAAGYQIVDTPEGPRLEPD